MTRREKEDFAVMYARRRVAEGFTPFEAAHLAALHYGLSMAAELRVEKKCATRPVFPTQGGALSARLAA